MRSKRPGRHWNELGRRNPFGAILTGAGGEVSQWNADEFFEIGRVETQRFLSDLNAIAPTLAHIRALDFGCGIGRITRALADTFEEVVGVDVAPSMIDTARELHAGTRCRFELNPEPHLRQFDTGTFNLVYSRLVLQHIRPVHVRSYIPELIRVLAPGGVLMFQLPEVVAVDPEEAFCAAPVEGGWIKRHLPRKLVRIYRKLKYSVIVDDSAPRMEMYGLQHNEVLSLIANAGGRLLQERPDQSHGTAAPGYEYWITK